MLCNDPRPRASRTRARRIVGANYSAEAFASSGGLKLPVSLSLPLSPVGSGLARSGRRLLSSLTA